jgi:hypothetical protein
MGGPIVMHAGTPFQANNDRLKKKNMSIMLKDRATKIYRMGSNLFPELQGFLFFFLALAYLVWIAFLASSSGVRAFVCFRSSSCFPRQFDLIVINGSTDEIL